MAALVPEHLDLGLGHMEYQGYGEAQCDALELDGEGSDGDEDSYDENWDVRSQLNADLSLIQRSGNFFAYIRPEPSSANPGLEIECLHRFGIPFQENDIRAIIAASQRASYGKSTEIIINENVRKTWEVRGSRLRLRHPSWPAELNKMVATVCDHLGVAGSINGIEAQLQKLLIYGEGATFRPVE